MHRLLVSPTSVLLFILFFVSCQQTESDIGSLRNIDFNNGWKFIEDSIPSASDKSYDESKWRTIDLPHDWSIEGPSEVDSKKLLFDESIPGGVDVGYLRGGTGWYRKQFSIDPQYNGKEILLHFDGVMSEMQLWVNGEFVGEHVYGYTPFNFNITPFLVADGQKNVIAIQVYKPTENSRWFTGAGINRSVEISYVNPIHVATWGVGIQTEVKDESNTKVTGDVRIVNNTNTSKEITIQSEARSPDGSVIEFQQVQSSIGALATLNVQVSGTLENPDYWDTDSPSMYSLSVKLIENGKQIDRYDQAFGIRSIHYSVDNGFRLNGKEILLKGACIHHDNGLLGAMAFEAAERRRVQILKENGYNAIRTAHNPPSKYFLEACDELGMLVIDEAFDMWIKPKRKKDYHQYFADWWKTDIESMVLRDRNHPSIIMWSFGNEVQERANPTGVEIGKNCIEAIRAIDTSRPITQAVCGFWDNPGKVWDESAAAFEITDISGYNYQWANYEADHTKHPNRLMYGSESVPWEAFENWELVKKHSYVIGDFVWTGMDYIGESGIGHAIYPAPTDEPVHLMPWPTYIAWCGDIDIIGNKKAQSYYRDILWENSKLEILVHEPNTSGYSEKVSFWGWPNEMPSWNWNSYEGSRLEVSVYSSFPKVKLLLNGNEVGEQEVSSASRYTATFEVPFEAGELKAIGLVGDEVMEEKILRTTGEIASILLQANHKVITADRRSIAYVIVKALDKDGLVVNNSEADITVNVQGDGELLVAGNANPVIQGSFTDRQFSLFQGQGLIIVRSSGEKGTIQISAESDNLPSTSIDISAN